MEKRNTYNPEFKTKVVLEVLREERTVNQIASLHELSPMLISRWKAEFLERASMVFEKGPSEAEKLKREVEEKQELLEKKIGQLIVEDNVLKKNLVSNNSYSQRKAMLESNPEPTSTTHTEFQEESEQLSGSNSIPEGGLAAEVIRSTGSGDLSDIIRSLESTLNADANPPHNIIHLSGPSSFQPEIWHPGLTVTRQASLLDVSRTGAYQPAPKMKIEAFKTISLMHRIDALYTVYPYYGSRRMVAALFREGMGVNRKRVQRLMRAMSIEAMYTGPNLSKRLHATYCRPYLLRHLDINRTNQVWGIDFTYIRRGKGFMFLFVVIDWFSRKIVDYELSSTIGKEVAIQCLEWAYTKNKPEIINSDQGSQFTNVDYLTLIAANDIKASMDGKGRARHNARTERFFRSIKYERIFLNEYDSPLHLRLSINEYVNYYNTVRPHQSNDYMKPEEMYAVGIAGLVA